MQSGGGAPARMATPVERGSERAASRPSSIMQIQRMRMLNAMVQVACEQGAANVSVADVVGRSGVSRRTFYEVFDSSQGCLEAAIEEALSRAAERVLAAYEERGDWRARIRAGLVALLVFFEERPDLGRLLLVEWLGAGRHALECRAHLLEEIASAIDEGSTARSNRDSEISALTGEAIVGAVASVLHRRLMQQQPGALVELTNPLMSMIVLPYLGAAAARKELASPLPDTGKAGTGPPNVEDLAPEELLRNLNIRLTYRTMRVLAAVAANPGGSNRAVAHAAGVGDQGQISKLLMRLRKLGLIENRGAPVKGEPNAWVLTATGERIEGLFRT